MILHGAGRIRAVYIYQMIGSNSAWDWNVRNVLKKYPKHPSFCVLISIYRVC